MQNKPNFPKPKMNITPAITKYYENISPIRKCENKPKTIPIYGEFVEPSTPIFEIPDFPRAG